MMAAFLFVLILAWVSLIAAGVFYVMYKLTADGRSPERKWVESQKKRKSE